MEDGEDACEPEAGGLPPLASVAPPLRLASRGAALAVRQHAARPRLSHVEVVNEVRLAATNLMGEE